MKSSKIMIFSCYVIPPQSPKILFIPQDIIGEPVNVDMFLNHTVSPTLPSSDVDVITADEVIMETKESELPWFMMSQEKRMEYVENLSRRIAETLNIEVRVITIFDIFHQ